MRNIFMTINRFAVYSFSTFLLLISLFLPSVVKAQTDTGGSGKSELFQELRMMDSLLFEVTAQNPDPVEAEKILAEDLEFYHDKFGLIGTSSDGLIKSLKSAEPSTEKRELVEGSLEVYPLLNYGALQMGKHRFYKKQENGFFKLYEKAKFTHLWKKEDDGSWKLSMVLSYDHQPVPLAEIDPKKQSALIQEMKELDSRLFDAMFNTGEYKRIEGIYTEDYEFYHDKGGLTGTSGNKVVEDLKNKGPIGEKREFVEGSLEVYPLNNYGALQRGEHLFYKKEEDGSYKLYEKAKYTHLWKKEENGQWTLRRVLSYDHQPAE